MIAQERQRFDEADVWYSKSLETRQRIGHPPLLVNALGQFGRLRTLQGRPREAVSLLGQGLIIASQYQMRVGGTIAAWLAGVMKDIGEEEFTDAWKKAFDGQDPPIDTLKQELARLENNSD